MEKGVLYFYTATALNWQNLFLDKKHKEIIINSLSYLSEKQLMIVYSFIIMPNHIHLILEIPSLVKHPEKVQHSFMSYTAHEFKKTMVIVNEGQLSNYLVDAKDRKYQFWERNPKIIPVSDFNMAGEIINYMHCNPLQSKWNLVKSHEEYHYSSAEYYVNGSNDFGFIKHYMEYFDRKVEL